MTKRKTIKPTDTKWRGDRRHKPPQWVLDARCPVLALPGAAKAPIVQKHTILARKRAKNVVALASNEKFRERRLERFLSRRQDTPQVPSGDGTLVANLDEKLSLLLVTLNAVSANITPEQRSALVARFVVEAL